MFKRRFGGFPMRSAATLLAATTILWCASAHTIRANGSGAESLNESAKLLASDGVSGDSFGSSLSIDGNTAIVGAQFADTVDGFEAGAAYVFVGSGGVWTQQAKLTATDGANGHNFGFAVAIDGDTVIVGAPGADSAYVFTRTEGVWTEQAKLSDAVPAPGVYHEEEFVFGLVRLHVGRHGHGG